jgi:flagellar biosynthetic protein FliQ
MNMEIALEATDKMLITAIWVAGPILGSALLIGLAISVIQVVTQVQEMTLTFVPKMIVIVLVLLFLGAWMLGLMTEFTKEMFQFAFERGV